MSIRARAWLYVCACADAKLVVVRPVKAKQAASLDPTKVDTPGLHAETAALGVSKKSPVTLLTTRVHEAVISHVS